MAETEAETEGEAEAEVEAEAEAEAEAGISKRQMMFAQLDSQRRRYGPLPPTDDIKHADN